MSLERRLHLSV